MLRAVAIVFFAAAAFVAVQMGLRGSEPEGPVPEAPAQRTAELRPSAEPTAEPTDQPAAQPAAVGRNAVPPPLEAEERAVRDVTPEGITSGPPVSGPLVRVEPPAPPPVAEAPRPARVERLFNPVIAAAGSISARDREIVLAAVAAPGPEESCGDPANAWPCGRMARAALRRFIRGRAIECEVPAGATEIPEVAQCSVGGQNLSEWLVAQGWARREGDSFAELEEKARQAGLGVWSARRPGTQSAGVATTSRANASAISERVSGTP